MLENKKARDHFVKTSKHLWQPPEHNHKKTEKKKPIIPIIPKPIKEMNRRGGIYVKETEKKDDIIDSESDEELTIHRPLDTIQKTIVKKPIITGTNIINKTTLKDPIKIEDAKIEDLGGDDIILEDDPKKTKPKDDIIDDKKPTPKELIERNLNIHVIKDQDQQPGETVEEWLARKGKSKTDIIEMPYSAAAASGSAAATGSAAGTVSAGLTAP